MGRFQEGLTVRDMADLTIGSSTLQDGVDEGVVDGLHDEPGVLLLVLRHGNIQDTHAPVPGILLPLVEGVAKYCNFGGLLSYHPPEGLLLPGHCDERRLQGSELHDQCRKFSVHLTLHFLHREGGFCAFFRLLFGFGRWCHFVGEEMNLPVDCWI